MKESLIGRFALLVAGLTFASACGDAPTEPLPPLRDPHGLILLGTVAYPAEIHVMRSDGSGRRQLTRDDYSDIDPHWSPDGRQIVFVRAEPGPLGASPQYQVHVMDADGRNIRRLHQREGASGGPRWSPDGRQIAFYHRDAPESSSFDYQIYVMNADGSHVRLVTAEVKSLSPDWSPDGSRLVFVARRPARPRQSLYTIKLDGSDEQLLAGDAACAGDAYTPRWSPDGARIVYRCDEASSGAIHMIQADGTNAHRLGPAQPSYVFESYPAWSPDGLKIIFFSNRFTSGHKPVVMDTLGNNAVLVGQDMFGLIPADWGALPQ